MADQRSEFEALPLAPAPTTKQNPCARARGKQADRRSGHPDGDLAGVHCRHGSGRTLLTEVIVHLAAPQDRRWPVPMPLDDAEPLEQGQLIEASRSRMRERIAQVQCGSSAER